MNISSKEEYLENLKNKMLFHFSHQDIFATLEDISLFFEAGMADGKTETELCKELGAPKELVHSLLTGKASNHFRAALLCLCMISCLTLYLHVFRHPDLLLSVIILMIMPASIWYLEGGACLFQIRSDTVKHYKIYLLFFAASLILISMQQLIAVLLKNDIHIPIPFIQTTQYASSILIVISIAIFITAICKLHKGYYLSFGILIISLGAVCSSLLYNDFLKRFSPPVHFYYRCSIPFILSLFMGILYYWSVYRGVFFAVHQR